MGLYKPIYELGILIRNNKIKKCYELLKESEFWDSNKLRQYQYNKLGTLINYAYDNSQFYRDKFDKHGFHPKDLKSLDDLKFLPILSKEELLLNANLIQITDCGEKLYFSETSGSTGRPLVFYRNQEWDAWHNASVLRGYSWHNVQPWERNGYLWGYNISPSKRLKILLFDTLQNRFRMFSYKNDEIEVFARKLEKAQYLEGYSSMLYEVAKRVNANNSSHKYDLKLIKGTSEKIFEVYQQEVEKAFGKKIVSEYGSAEGGIIAFECANGNMHINMETVIVEAIDGEIVVTNLVSKSFPVIRYKLGDCITLGDSDMCSCGMVHSILKEVTGRIGGVIRGKIHEYPSLTLYYVFKNLAIEKNIVLNYQVIQEIKGEIKVNIESILSSNEKNALKEELLKYFGDDVYVNIFDNIQVHDYKSKKKDFISRL